MALGRNNQLETVGEHGHSHGHAHSHGHPHEHVIADEQLAELTSFTTEGAIPAVEADQVRPPQPSASDRAYESRGGRPPVAPAIDSAVLTTPVTRVVHGVTIFAPVGTHANAFEEAAQIVQLEVGRNLYAQSKLAEARTTIVIIPARSRMTDLGHFASLRGGTTFDGRPWESVRGSGGIVAPDGSFAIGVAEENLIAVRGVVSTYTSGYSIGMHELAHALESKGLTPQQKARLDALYQRQKRQDRRDPSTHHDAFTDSYAAENKHEYFAQSTNAFFGRNAGAEMQHGRAIANHNSRTWLHQNDPDMYAFLVEIYETSYDAAGRRVE